MNSVEKRHLVDPISGPYHEWYVVDTRSGQIVNCITTHSQYPPSLEGWVDELFLTVTRRPTRTQLEGYQYWNERP